MENITSAISVQVDMKDKENANEILKNLGLNMSTFVNMAIKQLLYNNGLPFEVKNPTNNNVFDIQRKSNDSDLQIMGEMPDLQEFIKNN